MVQEWLSDTAFLNLKVEEVELKNLSQLINKFDYLNAWRVKL